MQTLDKQGDPTGPILLAALLQTPDSLDPCKFKKCKNSWSGANRALHLVQL